MDPFRIVGGLCLWWKDDVVVQINSKTKNIIDTTVTFGRNKETVLMTWVYGPTDVKERQEVWRKLKD